MVTYIILSTEELGTPRPASAPCVGAWRYGSVAFAVHDLAQGVVDAHQIAGILHDAIDVLVGAGDFVEQHFGPAELDPGHGRFEILHRVGGSRLGARHPPSRAVRRGLERLRIAEPADDVAARAHRTGNHAAHAFAGFYGAFARDPDVVAEVTLDLREVVVAIDALDLQFAVFRGVGPALGPELAPVFGAALAVDVMAQLAQHAVHHLFAIEQRELLRPFQVAQVIVELLGAFLEIGEIAIGKRDVTFFANLLD